MQRTVFDNMRGGVGAKWYLTLYEQLQFLPQEFYLFSFRSKNCVLGGLER